MGASPVVSENFARIPVEVRHWLPAVFGRLPLAGRFRVSAVFSWVLGLLAERGLLKGQRMGIDATTLEANAAMRSIVRRDTGETYEEVARTSPTATKEAERFQ